MEQNKFEYNQDMTFDGTTNQNMNMGMSMDMGCCSKNAAPMEMNVMCPPIQECPQERVCHRYLCYEVPHIMPCNTRIINHHIYRHTYTPCYTSCEENVVSNVYDRKCCF